MQYTQTDKKLEETTDWFRALLHQPVGT